MLERLCSDSDLVHTRFRLGSDQVKSFMLLSPHGPQLDHIWITAGPHLDYIWTTSRPQIHDSLWFDVQKFVSRELLDLLLTLRPRLHRARKTDDGSVQTCPFHLCLRYLH
ncbi:unnamed protein product [Knipowitschia caucasica]